MDKLEDLFKTIVERTKIKDIDYKINALEKSKKNIEVIIDFSLPEEGRPSKRSSILIFRYSDCFIEDHPDIVLSTPQDKIIQIIDDHTFTATSTSTHAFRPQTVWIILSDGNIEKEIKAS